jgi:2,4-dienoyl-CoA reductase-like NADH-dependent reductase (Old Yellow Enzyme family)/pyruvate/2-oxoglutarate dehydrogenase complex dihydrolipoamide dehydrogenase (E3) component
MLRTSAIARAAPELATLFSPFEVGGLRLRNRIVMPPMGTGLPSHDGHVTPETVAYYRRRAQGGVGIVCVEASLIAPDLHGVGPEIRLHDDAFLPGLRELASAVRDEGVPVGIQLWHPGRQTTLGEPVGPSAIPLSPRTPVPRALSRDDIARIHEAFADSARRCRAAGFDFVEVHSAHCYLPCEFLSRLANRRDDEYGGSLPNRARFLLELVAAVRAACGDDYPVFVRLSGGEGVDGGGTLEEAVIVARWLEEAGVACISVSAGSWHALHLTIPPMSMAPGCLLPYATAIKQAVNVPVMAAGRLDFPDLAERVLKDEQADLIGVGRALIADADWPEKVRGGRLSEIRPCIACNACVDLVAQGSSARCAVNPEVGREATWEVVPAAVARRVMVIGSGPAGMEAARVSRLRGHDVSIWDREPELGGKLDVASRAPSKHNVLRFRDFQVARLRELGVEVHLAREVDVETVREHGADVVVIATGADPLIPPIPGIEGPGVVDAHDVLLDGVTVAAGARVAIIGGSATGCETAEALLDVAGEITIIDMLARLGRGIEQITRRRLLGELREGGVRFLTRSKVIMIEPALVTYEADDGAAGSVAVDCVVRAIGWRPSGSRLADAISGSEVHVLGDASHASDFVAAVNAGADVGLKI